MEDKYVTFNQARDLKKLGFSEMVPGYYTEDMIEFHLELAYDLL